jgi:tetraacyldisaccharide 4'-kinase
MRIVLLILKMILYPIMLVLNATIYVRNWLFDINILKSVRTDVFTINVGNLNVGGTGKTPHVEYLVRLLADKYNTTILSRGYKRKTKGYILADETATAQSIGDEPIQYYQKFRDKINVAVCEDRVRGVNEIQTQTSNNQLVILDDAFQHRKIKPHLNLLLCDFQKPFYEDSLVPFGRLRDLRSSAKRADAVIVSKCPKDISYQKYKEIKVGIKAYVLPEIPVFFSRIIYKAVVGYSSNSIFKFKQDVNIVTGIAKPDVFTDAVAQQGVSINYVQNFPDHFDFSKRVVDKIIAESKANRVTQILTTEKDMVKIKPLLSAEELKMFFYIPIEIEIEDKKAFDAFVLGKIEG